MELPFVTTISLPVRLVTMTTAYARTILSWHYEPPYDVYNNDPATIEADITDVFLNPAYHYYAVLDVTDMLVAYRCFGEDARVAGGDYSVDALDMGGGLRPDLTGHGLGPTVMQAAMAFARQHFAPQAFRVTIATWNTRAQPACAKVGYRPSSTFLTADGKPFVIMFQSA